jgi:hypothetical protein
MENTQVEIPPKRLRINGNQLMMRGILVDSTLMGKAAVGSKLVPYSNTLCGRLEAQLVDSKRGITQP